MKYFYIYIGSNAAYEFLEQALQPYVQKDVQLRRIDRADIAERNILQENKDDVLALFLPGARSSQIYYDDLGGKGFAAIKDYVADGGSYIGICAGAYLACQEIAYEGPEIRKHGKHYDLDLFDGTAIGELPVLYSSPDHTVNSWNSVVPTNVDVTGHEDPVTLAYWRGPYYQPHPDEQIHVLAHYHDITLPNGNKPVAIAVKDHGKGKAVFCGVHPELSGTVLEQSPSAKFIDQDNGHSRASLAKALKHSETERLAIFRMMIHAALDTERGRDAALAAHRVRHSVRPP